MASNIKYPENACMWYVEGSNLAIITNVDSDGDTVSSERKAWKAIRETVTDGILLKYQAEPNKVSALSDSLDIDNTLQLAIVDYVKMKLYEDKAGNSVKPESHQMALQMANSHRKNYEKISRKYGMRKRDKVGGTRAVSPVDLR
jgi:hypothetical protein